MKIAADAGRSRPYCEVVTATVEGGQSLLGDPFPWDCYAVLGTLRVLTSGVALAVGYHLTHVTL